MILRKARKSDTEAIAAIHTVSWRDAYRPFLDADYLAGPVVKDRLNVWTERFARNDVSWDVTVAETEGELQGLVRMFGNIDIEFHESSAKQATKLSLRLHHIMHRDHVAIHTPQPHLISHRQESA